MSNLGPHLLFNLVYSKESSIFPGFVTEQHAAAHIRVTDEPAVHPIPALPLPLHLQAPFSASPRPVLLHASPCLTRSVLSALDPSQPRHAAYQPFTNNSHRCDTISIKSLYSITIEKILISMFEWIYHNNPLSLSNLLESPQLLCLDSS